MTNFKFNNGLENKVEIIVPSTVNVNEPIDNSAMVDKVITELSLVFGGASAFEQRGGWVSEDGELVKESNTVVYAYAKNLFIKEMDAVYSIAEMVCSEMNQEAVAVTINGTMYFVEQEKELIK